MEVKSVPDAAYSWALAETEEDETPKGLQPTDRLVVSPNGQFLDCERERGQKYLSEGLCTLYISLAQDDAHQRSLWFLFR